MKKKRNKKENERKEKRERINAGRERVTKKRAGKRELKIVSEYTITAYRMTTIIL